MLLIPVPSADHADVCGSNIAMLFAATLPATVKPPPTTNCAANGPAPSGSHITIAFTGPSTPPTPSPGNHCSPHVYAHAADPPPMHAKSSTVPIMRAHHADAQSFTVPMSRFLAMAHLA